MLIKVIKPSTEQVSNIQYNFYEMCILSIQIIGDTYDIIMKEEEELNVSAFSSDLLKINYKSSL